MRAEATCLVPRTSSRSKKTLPVQRIEWAHVAHHAPAFDAYPRPTAAQAQGLRFERRVQEAFTTTYAAHYVPNMWFVFKDRHGNRFCQPDGLLFDFRRGCITIVEIKYRHTAQAWWQLWELYLPVVRHVFPPSLWKYRCLEVVKWYDVAEYFPGQVTLTPDPLEILRDDTTAVHIYPPKG